MRKPTNQPPAPKPAHPLIGAGLHWKDEDGAVQWQASVIAVFPSGHPATGDVALIQFFEWGWGEPSTRRLIPIADLAASDRWVAYASVEAMNDHYERVDGPRNRQIQARKEAAAP